MYGLLGGTTARATAEAGGTSDKEDESDVSFGVGVDLYGNDSVAVTAGRDQVSGPIRHRGMGRQPRLSRPVLTDAAVPARTTTAWFVAGRAGHASVKAFDPNPG